MPGGGNESPSADSLGHRPPPSQSHLINVTGETSVAPRSSANRPRANIHPLEIPVSQVASSCLPRWPPVLHPTQVHPTQRRVSMAFAQHPRSLLVLSVLWVWAILTGAQWCLFVVCVLFLWAITRQSSSCGQATSQMGTRSLRRTANWRGTDFCLENSQSPEAHENR